MRMKQSRIHAVLLIIFFFTIFALDYQMFYLFAYPPFLKFLQNNRLNIVVSGLGILLTLFYYQIYAKYNLKLYTHMLKYSVLCMAVWFFLAVYSAMIYPNQPLSITLGFHATFLYVFLTIPGLTLIYLKNDPEILFKIMNMIVFIWYLILIYQHFEYEESGKIVFNIQELVDSTSRDLVRDYGIRLSLKSLGNIMILYNFDVFFNKAKSIPEKMIPFIQTLLGIYCLVIIQQTRGMILVVACSIAGMAVFGAKKINKKILILLLAFIAAAVLCSTGIISRFLLSFSTDSSNANRYGTSIRIEAVFYYLKCFLNSFFMGNGFSNSLYYFDVQHGPDGKFYYSDIGLIGLLGEAGLGAFVIYVYPVWRIVQGGLLAIRRRVAYRYTFLIGIGIYLTVSSATLIITATNMMIAFPVLIAYGEYVYCNLKREHKTAEG